MARFAPPSLLAALLALGGGTLVHGQVGSAGAGPAADVRYLASDRLAGRATGFPGADSAAAYIARRFEQVGLAPGASGGTWYQPYTVSADAPAPHGMSHGPIVGRNVIGLLRGRDPQRADQLLVLGAHYDHLGLGGLGSLDPDSLGVVHNGADDNASGVAALLETARRLAADPPARSVLFIAFSGEELGLLGSAEYVKHPAAPMDRVIAMFNFDMVGRLRDDQLVVFGVETAREFRAILEAANAGHRFDLTAQGDGYGPSDQTSFAVAHVPVLHFFTGTHEDYHRTTDDWERVNVDGLTRVAEFAADVARAVADRSGTALTFVDLPPPAAAADSGRTPGYGAYLGTIPDMTDNPGGVRISGVRAESPAAGAGLRGGDIITRIGDHAVPDLQAMTDALRAHVAGDVVEVVFRRDGEERRVTLTLGRRGG